MLLAGDSMSGDGGWVHIGHVINTPGNKSCCVIPTPEGDVAKSAHTYIYKGKLGGSE